MSRVRDHKTLWDFLADVPAGIEYPVKLSYVERCVLEGDYTPMRYLLSVEGDLPANVKFDLATQRAIANRWRRI